MAAVPPGRDCAITAGASASHYGGGGHDPLDWAARHPLDTPPAGLEQHATMTSYRGFTDRRLARPVVAFLLLVAVVVVVAAVRRGAAGSGGPLVPAAAAAVEPPAPDLPGREVHLPGAGGSPDDGPNAIPPIDQPRFEAPARARGWLGGVAAVVVVRVGGDVRAYPLAILLTSPYPAVGRPGSTPGLFEGWLDERLPAKTRVLAAIVGGVARVWRYDDLRRVGVVEETVGGRPVLVVFRPEVTSIADSSDLRTAPAVGAAGLFDPAVDDRVLHLTPALRDRETGSTWDATGLAVAGPLRGRRLAPLPHLDTFWYTWAAIHPDTTRWVPPADPGRGPEA